MLVYLHLIISWEQHDRKISSLQECIKNWIKPATPALISKLYCVRTSETKRKNT
jgi:hypothetical protein